MSVYAYIWEFRVRPEAAPDFERIYGSGGDWVQLFRRSEGFIETLLLKDRLEANRYLTVDRWQSETDYQRFRERFAGEYHDLDKRCENLTLQERSLGTYES